jgi:hypothetical protein
MVGLNDSRREEPENFRILLGAFNQSDLTGVQIRFIDLIIKVRRKSVLTGFNSNSSLTLTKVLLYSLHAIESLNSL